MSDTLVMDRIEFNLTRLKLSKISEVITGIAKTAEEQSKSYLAFLDDLLEEILKKAGFKYREPSRY